MAVVTYFVKKSLKGHCLLISYFLQEVHNIFSTLDPVCKGRLYVFGVCILDYKKKLIRIWPLSEMGTDTLLLKSVIHDS